MLQPPGARVFNVTGGKDPSWGAICGRKPLRLTKMFIQKSKVLAFMARVLQKYRQEPDQQERGPKTREETGRGDDVGRGPRDTQSPVQVGSEVSSPT